MKKIVLLTGLLVATFAGTGVARAQAIKTNLPFLLAGSPNVGIEWNVGQQLTVNGDALWMPYMFKKREEVLRALIGSVDLRYYVKPKYYYTNNSFDGFYIGPYAMYGNFNVGFGTIGEDYRRKGWGVSAGLSLGYKFYLSKRFRLDLNLGVGYAHLQYDKYLLGGEWAEFPLDKKNTIMWIGPTKFGVHLVYNIFK